MSAQPPRDPFTALAFEELQRPPAHRAKDFLGAAATLAIAGAILLQVINSLARPCGAQLNPRAGPGACVGISAIANHAHGVVTWGAAACAALAAATFVWYMFWGYKANGHLRGNGGTQR
jgi:ABC-type Fe3+-siderophore transport system permease subunit